MIAYLKVVHARKILGCNREANSEKQEKSNIKKTTI